MPRGRATGSKNRSTEQGDTPPATSPSPAFAVGDFVLPCEKIDGAPNPEYYATLLSLIKKRYLETVLIGGQNSNFAMKQAVDAIYAEAEVAGLTKREVEDRRTEAQRAEDVWKMICSEPESLLGVKDEDLKAFDRLLEKIEKRMDEADEKCYQVLEEILVKQEDARDARMQVGKEGRAKIEENRTPKAWRRRIQVVLRLRRRAKMKVPPNGVSEGGGWCGNQFTNRERPNLRRQATEAAHLLRFMVFVGRVGMDQSEKFKQKDKVEPADLIFQVGYHHAKFAATLWMHRTGSNPEWDKETFKYQFVQGVIPYDGSVQIMPIAHGKTELAIHWVGLEMGLHPRDPGIYLHAKADMAVQNLGAVKRFLNPNDGIGQRYMSLFPYKLAKTQNDQTRIRIEVKNPPKSPTWSAAGVDSASLGIDTDKQVLDDVVPQSDAEQPTERERRGRIIRGTFFSRKRSRNAFTLIIGNLWHYGDAVMQIIDEAKKGKLMYGVTIQRCGGPHEAHGKKPWEPLWPEMYDVPRLKQKYAELRSALYSAAMMCHPLADELRIVKRVRLYDPEAPEHKMFVENSVKYISLDPTATKESTSDKAGIVYAGFGDVRVTYKHEDHEVVDTEKRVRFLRAHEIHATQTGLTEYVESFAMTNPVDYVLAEAVGGFMGIIEMFRGKGIDAIPCNPRGKSKENRLRGVAPILDDGDPAMQHRAVAEFPGKRGDDGVLRLHPDFEGVVEQIVNFGVCAEDHALDAVNQLLGYLAPELGVGRGVVSEQVRQAKQITGDPRLVAIYNQLERQHRQGKHATSEQAEHEWMRNNWSSSSQGSSGFSDS